jgi:hypothetical protein
MLLISCFVCTVITVIHLVTLKMYLNDLYDDFDWVLFLTYPNLFETKGFVIVVKICPKSKSREYAFTYSIAE